jgi:hypothetical protein
MPSLIVHLFSYRFHHPSLIKLQQKILNISGGGVPLSEQKNYDPIGYHVFRVPDNMATISLSKNAWSDVWSRCDLHFQPTLCGVALLLCTIRELDSQSSVAIITTDPNFKNALIASAKIRNYATVDMATELQGREFDIVMIACTPNDTFSSKKCFFASTETMTVALTRARKSIFVFGKDSELDSSNDAKDLKVFAQTQFEENNSTCLNMCTMVPLDKSLSDVTNHLKSIVNRNRIPSWNTGYYAANPQISNVPTVSLHPSL